MIELEDIVPRRDYKLLVDWNCSKCGKLTQMMGTILPNEPLYQHNDQYGKLSLVSWEDILHKKCKCGQIEKPTRKCSRCNSQYNFDAFGCKPCDDRIKQILTLEEDILEIKDRIRIAKRRKEDLIELEYDLKSTTDKLYKLDVIPCTVCGKIWLSRGEFCKVCAKNEQSQLS